MRIGILTQPLGHNYGGILQNWALQQVLIRDFHQPYTVTYCGSTAYAKLYWYMRNLCVYLVKCLIFHPHRYFPRFPWDRRPYTNLRRFLKFHIVSTHYLSINLLSKYCSKHFDTIIVGSDQVWRPEYNVGHLSKMFVSFLQNDSKMNVFAYAASFGVDFWEFSPEQTEMALHNVKRFSKVTVREKGAVKLCRNYLKVEALQVLDPTLLLDSDDYLSLLSENDINEIPENRVGVFILDVTDKKRHLVERVCEALGKEPYYFGERGSDKVDMDGVEHWLAAFERCKFIITDSFHGSAFSINFNKPFIALVNPKRGADRFTSLFSTFGLSDRLVETGNIDRALEVSKSDIDWIKVNEILEVERKKSLSVLKEGLMESNRVKFDTNN